MTESCDELPPYQVAYYRQVILTHGSVFGESMCHICGVARCPDWIDAYDKLAAAGALMVEPSRLPPRPPERSRGKGTAI